MTALETGRSSTAVQRSAQMPSGEPMLSVLAKRTYQIDRYGHPEVAELQTQLIEEPQTDPEYPDVLLADIDLHPYKLRSDVIIFGHAYGIGHLRRLDAGIRIGRHQRRLAVVGERRCSLSPTGGVRISEPAPIDRVALHPSSTFGGRDHAAEARYFDLVKEDPQFSESMLGVDPRAASPFRYPRNPVGRGYCIDISADALEQLSMPLLEDLGDPLTAERLLTHRANRWHRMPLPSITGFIDYSWYPRVGFFGIVPIVEFFDEPPLEVERGIAPGYLADGTGAVTPQARFDVQSGADPYVITIGMLKRRYKPQKSSQLDHIVQFSYDETVPDSAPSVVGYLRVSTTERKDEGVSLDVQRERIVAYCKMFQHNLIAIYADDHTGRNIERPGFQAALARMVETDSLLMAVSMDRISRNVGDWTYLLDKYFGKGAKHKLLAFDCAGMDPRTATGRMLLMMRAVMAQGEIDSTSERTQVAMDHLKAQGIPCGGLPYGLPIDHIFPSR